MHASHFSRPPSLLEAEGGLYSHSGFWRTAKTNHTDLRCGGELLTHWSPFPLGASGAAGLEAFVLAAASGRGETSPSLGTRIKKKSHSFITRVLTCFLVLFTFDAPVEPVYSIRWVGGSECAR